MTYSRHYCYRIDFADGLTYFGVRTCSCSIASDSSYMGSPVTHAAKWLTDTPRVKAIVSVHATRELANAAEAKLIRDFWSRSGKAMSLNAAIRGAKFNTLGTKHTAETRAKLSGAKLGKKLTAKHCAKIGAVTRDTKWYTDGANSVLLKPGDAVPEGFLPGRPKASDETRAKQSVARRGGKRKPSTEETRAKIRAAQKGKRWYTNGVVSRRLNAYDVVPEGFSPGRPTAAAETRAKLSEICTKRLGFKWYTDGATSVQLNAYDEVPEGFVPGRRCKRKPL